MERADQLREDFKNILRKWKEALDEPETEITRDAAILRFELSYEVGWKLIKALAQKEGIEVNSPRSAFEQAFSMGWVSNEEIWFEIIEARNVATHVYRENYAQSLYNELNSYYKAFAELGKAVKKDS